MADAALTREEGKPCPTCRRRVATGMASRIFPAYHARCIEKAVQRARALAG